MTDTQPYVIIRTYSAGAHAGYLTRRDGQEVELRDARRLWYWAGAATLSQLAVEGTHRPKAIEVIAVTDRARESIEAVPVWSA